MKTNSLWFTLALGLGLISFLLWLMSISSGAPRLARAATEITVCPDGTCDHTSIQDAVEEAVDGDIIKVAAFTYHGLCVRPRNDTVTTGVVTQVVYIDKSVTIRGGYTASFAEPPDPVANPTTLDPQRRGRGLYITGDISPTIEGLRITNGDAAGQGGLGPVFDADVGGGVFVYSATVTISNCHIFSNTADASPVSAGYGGGLFLAFSSGRLIANTVTGNTTSDANGKGGGVYLMNSDVTLTGNTFADNHTGSNGDGGGLYLQNSDATLNGNTITGNSATRSGGGLHLYISDATLSGNTVTENTVSIRDGGGLYLTWSHGASLSGNTVYSNTAGRRGGGIYLHESDVTLSGNSVIFNTAKGTALSDGGGGMYLDDSSVALDDNTITDNSTSANGGGLYLYDSENVEISGNTISANTATLNGGGLFLFYGSAEVESNQFADNTAGVGGGVYLDWTNVTLVNNIVADNHAETEGSGLYIRRCSPNVHFNTIANNTGGDGSGVYVTDWAGSYSAVELANTIVVDHLVGVTVTVDNTANLDATLWYGNVEDNGGPGISHTNDHYGDPSFVHPDGRDYHIHDDSAARDNGADVSVYTDMDGQLRPEGSGYDIGADEFWPFYQSFLPVVVRGN